MSDPQNTILAMDFAGISAWSWWHFLRTFFAIFLAYMVASAVGDGGRFLLVRWWRIATARRPSHGR